MKRKILIKKIYEKKKERLVTVTPNKHHSQGLSKQ